MYDSNYVTLWKRQNYRNSNKRLEVSGGLGAMRDEWVQHRIFGEAVKIVCVVL